MMAPGQIFCVIENRGSVLDANQQLGHCLTYWDELLPENTFWLIKILADTNDVGPPVPPMCFLK